ncbi:MAG: hypothetical protein ACRDP8_06085 [Actinopolymorphaceae bacterium]
MSTATMYDGAGSVAHLPVHAAPTAPTVTPEAGASSERHEPVDGAATVRPVRSWPVLLLALPAFVAVWSGWVGLGKLTGFGMVHPLPGIADDFTINSAITLPIGVETYAAFALRVWLSGQVVHDSARRFAKWSAIGSLILGGLGQVAYHLLVAAGVTRAPWQITTVVACLPVAVLGMGAALAHLLHHTDNATIADAEVATGTADTPAAAGKPNAAEVRQPKPVRKPANRKPANGKPARQKGATRKLLADYVADARTAWAPGVEITPAWVRSVTDCARGTSKAVADALRAELGTPAAAGHRGAENGQEAG